MKSFLLFSFPPSLPPLSSSNAPPLLAPQASVRFNSSLASNTQLRTRIDHLRQEKDVFQGIHRKLQKVQLYILAV